MQRRAASRTRLRLRLASARCARSTGGVGMSCVTDITDNRKSDSAIVRKRKSPSDYSGTPERREETAMTDNQLANRRRWIALALLCVAQFVVVLDASIVNVALPTIGRALHFTESDLPWVVNAYVLTFGGFLLLGGRTADLLGRRVVFMSGLVLFAIASLLGGLSTTSGQLIGARALQ